MSKGQSLETRFWSKVNVGSPNECWEWAGHRWANGYGSFLKVSTRKKTQEISAHRMSYMLHHNLTELSDELHVCHSCDNKPCCNPDHLWLGTAQDNMTDKVNKHRQPVGENHWTKLKPALRSSYSKLKPEQVIEILERLDNGESQASIARLFGVKPPSISRIKIGKRVA